jgi:hypothetical protein
MITPIAYPGVKKLPRPNILLPEDKYIKIRTDRAMYPNNTYRPCFIQAALAYLEMMNKDQRHN